MLSHDLHHSGQSDFVGPHSVSIKWMKTIIGFTKSSPLVGVDPSANPTIYIGAAYNVCAIDAVTSLVHWCHQLPGNVRRNTAAIGVDGTIYMGDRANRLNAINPNAVGRITCSQSDRGRRTPDGLAAVLKGRRVSRGILFAAWSGTRTS